MAEPMIFFGVFGLIIVGVAYLSIKSRGNNESRKAFPRIGGCGGYACADVKNYPLY